MNLYGQLFKSFIFPYFEKLKGRKTAEFVNQAEARLSSTSDELASYQLEHLKELLLFCNEHVPYYKKQWLNIGFDPAKVTSVEDLHKLPVLTKDDVKEHYADLVPAVNKGTNIKKSTGGSTGQPFHFELDLKSYETRQAIMWRGYGWLGAGLGVKSWFLWGIDLGEPTLKSQIKTKLYHSFNHRKIANSFAMNQQNMASYVKSLNHYKPEAIVGFVGPLYSFAKYINANKIKIKSPNVLLTGAEALHEFQRDELEQAFGCKVYNTYGCREFMLIAAECQQQKGLHINIDQLVVETLDKTRTPVMEQSGDIAVTDLFNYGMPLIRYINGDQATLSKRQCECGNPLPLIEKIDGRKLDIIKTNSGVELPGEFFPHLLKDFNGIERFQVKQKTLDAIDILYITNEHFTGGELASIDQELQRYTEQSLLINFHKVDEIPLTPSGKHRVTISEL